MRETQMKILCDKCRKVISPISDGQIELGSWTGNGLIFKDDTKGTHILKKTSLRRHRNLDFCSKECFVDFLFPS